MKRFARFRPAGFALAALGLLFIAQPALAGPKVPHKESCDGTVKFPALGVLTFEGKGVATHMGKYLIKGANQLTPDGKIVNGTFKSLAADGSTIGGIYSGKYFNLPNNKVQFEVNVIWQKGTGRLAGVTGEAAVVAIVDLNTNTYHYDTLGYWQLP